MGQDSGRLNLPSIQPLPPVPYGLVSYLHSIGSFGRTRAGHALDSPQGRFRQPEAGNFTKISYSGSISVYLPSRSDS